MRSSRWRPAERMCSTLPRWRSSRSDMLISWPKPRTALSGVRSSWLIREMNSSFARFARSASTRRNRSVMSWLVPIRRRRPSASARFDAWTWIRRPPRDSATRYSSSIASPSTNAACIALATRRRSSGAISCRNALGVRGGSGRCQPWMRACSGDQRTMRSRSFHSQLPTPAMRCACSRCCRLSSRSTASVSAAVRALTDRR